MILAGVLTEVQHCPTLFFVNSWKRDRDVTDVSVATRNISAVMGYRGPMYYTREARNPLLRAFEHKSYLLWSTELWRIWRNKTGDVTKNRV